MANYQWNFTVTSPHTVLVEHPFSGDIVIHLDGKEVHRYSGRELEYEFRIEGKPCLLCIHYETKSYGGIATVQTWTHDLLGGREAPRALFTHVAEVSDFTSNSE